MCGTPEPFLHLHLRKTRPAAACKKGHKIMLSSLWRGSFAGNPIMSSSIVSFNSEAFHICWTICTSIYPNELIVCIHNRATRNSRYWSQKFPPPLSLKIPENSRYENTPYHMYVSVNLSKSSFIFQLLINPSSKAFDSDQIGSFDFPIIHGISKIRYEITYQWLWCITEIANNTRMDRKTNN